MSDDLDLDALVKDQSGLLVDAALSYMEGEE